MATNPAVRLQEKWRWALTLLRQVRASGITATAVLGHVELGDNATSRRSTRDCPLFARSMGQRIHYSGLIHSMSSKVYPVGS